MTKQELIAAMARKTGLTKNQAAEAIDTLGEIIRDEMRIGGDVTIPGVCKLSIKNGTDRPGAVPHFSAAQALKIAITG